MPLYKFKTNDIFHNTIKTHPRCEFFIHIGNVYYNNRLAITGTHVTNTRHVPVGDISLYEINIDRAAGNLVYQFVTKDGSQSGFKTTSTSNFNSDFAYGDVITGSYPLSASISIDYYTTTTRPRIVALRNTLDYYKTTLSPYYNYETYYSASSGDLPINLISIPSIFYGSSIKKVTVDF